MEIMRWHKIECGVYACPVEKVTYKATRGAKRWTLSIERKGREKKLGMRDSLREVKRDAGRHYTS